MTSSALIYSCSRLWDSAQKSGVKHPSYTTDAYLTSHHCVADRMIFHKNIKKCQWGEPAWLAALAHFTAWLSRTAHALFPHKICNEFLWEGGLGCFQRSWLAVAAWTEISFSRPACLQKKTLFCIFIDTISSQSCYMPTKIELFMSVTLVCWLSWKKTLNPDSCKYECVCL